MLRHSLLLASVLVAAGSIAQVGLLDPGFAGDGTVLGTIGTNTYASANDVAVGDDGRVVVVGTTHNNDPSVGFVQCFLDDGSPDASFSTDGVRTLDVASYCGANAVVIQPDGRIVVAGMAYSSGTLGRFVIWRLMSDGSLDPDFGNQGVRLVDFTSNNDEAYGLALRADGAIMLVGTSQPELALARLTPDGDLDLTFSGDGKLILTHPAGTITSRNVMFMSNGDVICGGSIQATIPGDQNSIVLRVDPAGNLRSSFGTDGVLILPEVVTDESVQSVAVTNNGLLIACGSRCQLGQWCRPYLLRLSEDGVIDGTFGTDGVMLPTLPNALNGVLVSVAARTDGKLALAGWATDSLSSSNTDALVMRTLETGEFDLTFTPTGYATTDIGPGDYERGNRMVLDPEQRMVLAGTSMNAVGTQALVARYLTTLSIGVQEFAEPSTLRVHPQPMQGAFTLQWHAAESGSTTLELLDALGRSAHIYWSHAHLNAGDHKQELEIPAGLSPGTYLLKLTSGSGAMVLRVVIG